MISGSKNNPKDLSHSLSLSLKIFPFLAITSYSKQSPQEAVVCTAQRPDIDISVNKMSSSSSISTNSEVFSVDSKGSKGSKDSKDSSGWEGGRIVTPASSVNYRISTDITTNTNIDNDINVKTKTETNIGTDTKQLPTINITSSSIDSKENGPSAFSKALRTSAPTTTAAANNTAHAVNTNSNRNSTIKNISKSKSKARATVRTSTTSTTTSTNTENIRATKISFGSTPAHPKDNFIPRAQPLLPPHVKPTPQPIPTPKPAAKPQSRPCTPRLAPTPISKPKQSQPIPISLDTEGRPNHHVRAHTTDTDPFGIRFLVDGSEVPMRLNRYGEAMPRVPKMPILSTMYPSSSGMDQIDGLGRTRHMRNEPGGKGVARTKEEKDEEEGERTFWRTFEREVRVW